MKRKVFTITINYQFDNARKGAKYTFDGGQTHKNGGEALEIMLKSGLKLEAVKDANTSFDKGDDIPEYKASVKSPKFTLTTVKLGNDFETIVSEYFKRTASEQVIWGYIAGEEIVTYWMSMDEFREYLEAWGYYDSHSGYVRGKALSGRMLRWLEARVVE